MTRKSGALGSSSLICRVSASRTKGLPYQSVNILWFQALNIELKLGMSEPYFKHSFSFRKVKNPYLRRLVMYYGHILQTLGKLSHQCPENWLYYPHWYAQEVSRICNWLIIGVASSTKSRIKNPSCICHSSQLVFWWGVKLCKAIDAVCCGDAQDGKVLTNHRLLLVCLDPSFTTIGSPSAWGFCHEGLFVQAFFVFHDVKTEHTLLVWIPI